LAAKLTGYKIDIKGESGEEFSVAADETTIDDLPISRRVKSTLDKAEISSVAQLRAKVEAGESIEGIGEKSLEEIKAALAEINSAKPGSEESPSDSEAQEQ